MRETKFKPQNVEDELLKFGIYFKSESDIDTHYFIDTNAGSRFDGNVLVKIYTIDFHDLYFDADDLESGNNIGIFECYAEWIADVDLCGKYFFPKFNNELQLYYDDEKYYQGKYKSDPIKSLMEAINFGIESGLKVNGIKPY